MAHMVLVTILKNILYTNLYYSNLTTLDIKTHPHTMELCSHSHYHTISKTWKDKWQEFSIISKFCNKKSLNKNRLLRL